MSAGAFENKHFVVASYCGYSAQFAHAVQSAFFSTTRLVTIVVKRTHSPRDALGIGRVFEGPESKASWKTLTNDHYLKFDNLMLTIEDCGFHGDVYVRLSWNGNFHSFAIETQLCCMGSKSKFH